jgi:hypothetical protein
VSLIQLHHPLIFDLISAFDDDSLFPVIDLVTELFITLSAFYSTFISTFLSDPQYERLGYEKMIHVRDKLGPGHPLPLLLAYNVFSSPEISSWSV